MNSRTAWIHPLVKAVLLIGFAAYVAYLVKTDRMLYYIAPRMTLYVKLSALGLYAVGAFQLYAAYRAASGKRDAGCDCGHDHDHTAAGSPWKSAALYGLFAFPLLLGFLTPDATLGSALAAKKGMNLSSAAPIKPAARGDGEAGDAGGADRLFPSDPFTAPFAKLARELYPLDVVPVSDDRYIETLTTLDLYADRFAGKTVKLSGFVYRDETIPAGRFVLGRFSVECCSADAAPYGVLVEYDRAALYATDQWLEVTGTIGKTKRDGDELLSVRAQKIVKIDAPKEPYVYPNFELGR
ncbi:TIGR03943 family putative permease subunit [Paenibacillus sp. GYB003]|uniref:TIGR03943 family putative permease subunit n=1 Tax=Paenibacillus sp. GYB003 TaxID=2994392 RepID=UPI002F9654A8